MTRDVASCYFVVCLGLLDVRTACRCTFPIISFCILKKANNKSCILLWWQYRFYIAQRKSKLHPKLQRCSRSRSYIGLVASVPFWLGGPLGTGRLQDGTQQRHLIYSMQRQLKITKLPKPPDETTGQMMSTCSREHTGGKNKTRQIHIHTRTPTEVKGIHNGNKSFCSHFKMHINFYLSMEEFFFKCIWT